MKSLANLRSRFSPFSAWLATATALTSAACSGELDDQETFQTQVQEGLGAKGVTRAGGSGPGPTAGPTTSTPTPTPNVPPPSSGLSANCADIEQRIFKTKCAGAACHGEPGNPPPFYSDLVTPEQLGPAVKDVQGQLGCTSMKLVDSANPGNSALLKVITPDHRPCTSSQMPSGLAALTDEEVACVTEWVNAVAAGTL